VDAKIAAELAQLRTETEQLAACALSAVEEQFVLALRRPLATATDIVSGRRFLVFDEGEEVQRFLVERADGGRVASFDSWAAVLAWHDSTLVSAGLEVRGTL
jgi:hypothetical protein